MALAITRQQARHYLLQRQGLLGARRFRGADGLLDYVRRVGCVQFDPVDICGRSHELAFLARVEGFTRELLYALLYERRELIDYFDKNMCVMSVGDWPSLEPTRQYFREHGRSHEAIDAIAPEVLKRVHERGCLSAQELGMKERVDWWWSATTLARAALETLYFRGDLVIHHKRKTIKSYALASDCLPKALLDAPCPLQTEAQLHAWQVKRRIGAVGMLWNAPSDAWLGMNGFKAAQRDATFTSLLSAGEIVPVEVEGIKRTLYAKAEDAPLLREEARPASGRKRARLLAPLDCLLWDRKLISALFDFDYKWEVYTPEKQRKYAHYTLPVLYGERFAGRTEPICDRKADVLVMNRLWLEKGFRRTPAFDAALAAAAEELRAFHGLSRVVWGASRAEKMGDGFATAE